MYKRYDILQKRSPKFYQKPSRISEEEIICRLATVTHTFIPSTQKAESD